MLIDLCRLPFFTCYRTCKRASGAHASWTPGLLVCAMVMRERAPAQPDGETCLQHLICKSMQKKSKSLHNPLTFLYKVKKSFQLPPKGKPPHRLGEAPSMPPPRGRGVAYASLLALTEGRMERVAIAVRCVGDCSALRWRLQCAALAIAVRCVGDCGALRWRLRRVAFGRDWGWP